MALQKNLALMSVELAQRINDAVSVGDANGTILTSDARMSYINKAMLKMVDDVWNAVKGDKKLFIALLPELSRQRIVTLGSIYSSSKAAYQIATPNLDFFQLIEASVDNGTSVVQGAIIPSAYSQTVLNGKIPQMLGDLNNPMVVEIGGTITFAPIGSFMGCSATLTIIKLPINGYDGSFLQITQGANLEDSPFYPTRNSKIIDYAQQLYNIDANLIS